jgi:hypothetical protein
MTSKADQLNNNVGFTTIIKWAYIKIMMSTCKAPCIRLRKIRCESWLCLADVLFVVGTCSMIWHASVHRASAFKTLRPVLSSWWHLQQYLQTWQSLSTHKRIAAKCYLCASNRMSTGRGNHSKQTPAVDCTYCLLITESPQFDYLLANKQR